VLLHHFEVLIDSFLEHNIAVHAVTAEPGGSAELRRKLKAHGLPTLNFPIHSDPHWTLMEHEPQDLIYVQNPSHPFLLEAKQIPHSYRMVQPAMVVVDRQGRVEYWWSWKKLTSGILSSDGVLPNERRADNPDGNTHDVRWRPVPAHLLQLLTTPRADLETLRVENLGFPTGKDHVRVKKLLRRNPADHARSQLRLRRGDKPPAAFNDLSEAKL